MRLSAKYRSRKFLRFPKATALQHCKLNCSFGGGKDCRGLGAVDAPNQFPNYVIFAKIERMVYTPLLKTPELYHTSPSGAIGVTQRKKLMRTNSYKRILRP